MQDYLDQRIGAISQLGRTMGLLASESAWPGYSSGLSEEEFNTFHEIITTHYQSNGWFTPESIRKSLHSWSAALTEEHLRAWLSAYEFPADPPASTVVAVICAGNLPMVGWHDVLSVLITGNKALIKLSSDDPLLIPALLQILVRLHPDFGPQIEYVQQKMTGQQAVIATGSNNTSRYFNYYFRDLPHIIRKSRTSVAILDGSESAEEIALLGNDIFDYFGLGCRNVSKMYLPEGFDLNRFFNAIYPFNPIVNHHKYANNYDYNKAVWLLNSENLLDNGFILLKEEKQLASPTASLYYEYYADLNLLKTELESRAEELQCIVSHAGVGFGQSQQPMLWDYADGVDTLRFLLAMKSA